MNQNHWDIRLMADYGCYPIWVQRGDIRETVHPSTLPISDSLCQRLLHWQAQYDAILNQDDPASSAFASPEEERTFEQMGWELARTLKTQLPCGSCVVYFVPSVGEDKKIDEPPPCPAPTPTERPH